MKCPKCGFNSFEYHDVCNKCAQDLTGYKQTYGIQAIVLPREAREALASAHTAETAETGQTTQTAEAVADMFSFDLPVEEAAAAQASPVADGNPFNFDEEQATPDAPPAIDHDPFSFDEETDTPEPPSFFEASPDEPPMSSQAKAEEDAFASLLESSGHDSAGTAVATPPAAAPDDTTAEFELENFSWDDIPSAPEQAAPAPTPETADQAPGEFDLENFSWDNAPPQQPAPPSGQEVADQTPGEFDLEDFSWEETPTAPAEADATAEDDSARK